MFPKVYLMILVVLLVVLIENQVDGCSCMASHPQEQFCNADFVIVARIKRDFVKDMTRIYKARIKKEFKMSEKARVSLKSGKLFTAEAGSMCGANLRIGEIYLITGRVMELKAHVSLCGFIKPWRELTSRQRKGFRLIYKRGCTCKISWYNRYKNSKDHCAWDKFHCQHDHGICLRSPSGQCHWSKSLDLRKCINNHAPKHHNSTVIRTHSSTTALPMLLPHPANLPSVKPS